MSLSLQRMNVITVFAEDLAETKAFYEKVLGLEVLGEEKNEFGPSVVFKLGNIMINLAHVTAGPDFCAPGAVAPRGEGRGSSSPLPWRMSTRPAPNSPAWVSPCSTSRATARGASGVRASSTPLGTSGRSPQTSISPDANQIARLRLMCDIVASLAVVTISPCSSCRAMIAE